jgi:hypothetical protein
MTAFLASWIIAGMFLAAALKVKGTRIHEEPSQGVRSLYVVIAAPCWFFSGLALMLILSVITTAKGIVATLSGKNPDEKGDKE